MMQILGFLGMNFDAVIVFGTIFRLATYGHTAICSRQRLEFVIVF